MWRKQAVASREIAILSAELARCRIEALLHVIYTHHSACRVAMDLASTVERIQQNFCICDPNLPDNPIVFASDGFLEMSQYDRFEVLGRNCRFLQVVIHC